MKCYYEELGIARDVDDVEIKTAYRKLALKWHPDKNMNNAEEAKEKFQLIQQAYEVLSDPQERAWYDNHRDQILRGKNSDYEDKCLDVFQYFTSSCFKGYGDDDKGFYAVYREVFEKLKTEDAEFMEDEEDMHDIPMFGDSQSSYEDVVGPFYAYWSAYCTKKTYSWLCPYDIQEIKDRRILREIEKEMKKKVKEAKRERNEEIRNLVSFMRKRDRRVQAYRKKLEEKAAANREKQEQNRLDQLRRRQQELKQVQATRKDVFNSEYEDQLKQLAGEYSCSDESDEEDIEYLDDVDDLGAEAYIDDLYCIACNKSFKNEKAFSNHESSKKHRENVEQLKDKMLREEADNSISQSEEESAAANASTEEQLTDRLVDAHLNNSSDEEAQAVEIKSETAKSKKNKKSNKKSATVLKDDCEAEEDVDLLLINQSDDDDWASSSKKASKKTKSKKPTKVTASQSVKEPKNSSQAQEVVSQEAEMPKEMFAKPVKSKTSVRYAEPEDLDKPQHVCVTCHSKFDSKNKLFNHLKITNHGVPLAKSKAASNSKANKGKQRK